MKKDIILTITLSSAIVVGVIPKVGEAATADVKKNVAKTIEGKSTASSGKCASGKCGTEKIYDKVKLKKDPQDQLISARDGKCGVTGKGIDNKESPQKIKKEKCIGGLCGK